jgi:hypothetical protein
MDVDGAQLTRMIERGRMLKALTLRFPCGFTLWMLRRQVERIEAVLGPPDRLSDTWGRLYRRGKQPLALAHDARVRREKLDAAHAEARRQVDEILRQLSAHPGSGSGRSARSRRQRQHAHQADAGQ